MYLFDNAGAMCAGVAPGLGVPILGWVGLQAAALVVGLVLAFVGERVHEVVITLVAFLFGAAFGLTGLAPMLLSEGAGGQGFGLTAILVVVVVGILVAMLVWVGIYLAVFLTGAGVGYLAGATVTGVWSPLWVGGGFLAGGFGLLFLLLLAMGCAFVAAYLGQATGNHGLRDLAFEINTYFERAKVSTTHAGERKTGTDKFEEGSTYFDSPEPTRSSGRDYPVIPEDRVKNSGTLTAAFLALVGLLSFGVMIVLTGLIFGLGAVAAAVLHPTLRGGFLVALASLFCGSVAVRLYRPYIAVSTASSGAFLIAFAATSQRTLQLLLAGNFAGLVRYVQTSSAMFLVVFTVVFLAGAAYQLRHIHHSDPLVAI